MADTKQINATVDTNTVNTIVKISEAENRSFSQIVAILLRFSTSPENLAKIGLKSEPTNLIS